MRVRMVRDALREHGFEMQKYTSWFFSLVAEGVKGTWNRPDTLGTVRRANRARTGGNGAANATSVSTSVGCILLLRTHVVVGALEA